MIQQTHHQDELQYSGTPVFFSGKHWLIPSLSVGQFMQNYDLLAKPIEGSDLETVKKRYDTYIGIIGQALRRNYPGVVDADLYEALDLHTFSACLHAVQTASGMKVVTPGEFKAATETKTAP